MLNIAQHLPSNHRTKRHIESGEEGTGGSASKNAKVG